jgi:hypothetical protein
MDRVEILTDGLELERPGLEIGPLHNPAVPKKGNGVLYVDHLPTEQLHDKYRKQGFPHCDDIRDVDIVVDAAGLASAVGGRKFAYVVASHVIEHIPNPLQWFKDIHGLLQPGGVLSLAIPDKRYCFDRLRDTTTVAQWVDAWLRKQDRPSAANILDALGNEVGLNGEITWHGEIDSGVLRHLSHPREALRVAREVHANGSYRDVHCSVFTPASFCLLLRQLCVLDLLDFTVDRFQDTIGHEFFVRLRKPETDDWMVRMASIPLFHQGRYAALPAAFDPSFYLQAHADVAAARMDPAEHFLEYGRNEGRIFCAAPDEAP